MKAVKVNDIGTEHDGFHPTKVTAGSPDVFIDGLPAGRVGDPLEPHDKPNHPKHGRAIATGSSTVFINGKPAALTGGKVSCGGVTIGSGTVNIGDEPTSGTVSKLLPVFNRKFILKDSAGEPVADSGYKLVTDAGNVVSGQSNADGSTNFVFSKDAPVRVKAHVEGLVPDSDLMAYMDEVDTTSDTINDPFTLTLPDYEIYDVAILTAEEKSEFEKNLWEEHQVKNKLNRSKSLVDLSSGSVDALFKSKGLGGYGVRCRRVVRNGVEYYILSNYKQHLKTLLKGTRYRGDNPKLAALGLGRAGMKASAGKGALITVLWSGAVNGVDVACSDKKTFSDWFASTAVDSIIAIAALFLGSLTAVALGPATVLGGELIVAGSGFVYGEVMANSMNAYGFTGRATKALKDFWEDVFGDGDENKESK
ncbi:type VI secretion system PAAR protein [Halodesulfovibrio aestuarii]|uniref:Type VI secretion system PAAR protein n=1 Tax=Halodesulfovibrio aestuarii TaxID=126333 RepID=A0ABV4JQL8_9BACT